MQRRFKQAYTALKEHGHVKYAKIATMGGFCDINFMVIKATSPDDFPLRERYIYQLLKIFSLSPSAFRAFALSFTRRFGRTQSWRVALKCLLLIHRLLRSLPENSPFRSDLLWFRTNGLLSLYPCRFQDYSSSGSKDFTVFIHSYARLLDEALDCFSIGYKNEQSIELSEKLSEKMQEVGRVLEVLPQLQNLIDRVIECNPIGSVARSFLVRSAMKQIVRDSFICYAAFRRDIVILLDNLFQLQYRSCISGFGIYKRAETQAIRLSEFYDSCKAIGFCGSFEYPFIDQIPHIHVQALESFLNGMWQLTESSSSETTPRSSTVETPSTLTEDEGGEKQLARLETVISTEWEKFEDDEKEVEMEPLIQLEIDDDISWEDLLEASASVPRDLFDYPKNFFAIGYDYGRGCEYEYEYGYGSNTKYYRSEGGTGGWQMQVYNDENRDRFNPYLMPNRNENSAKEIFPWGL